MHLEDYSCESLALIAETRAASELGLTFGTTAESRSELRSQVATLIEERYAARIPQENAALAVNIVEAASCMMAERLMGCEYDEATATILTAADFGIEEDRVADSLEKREAVEKELQQLTGMGELKQMLNGIRKQALYVERGGNPKVLQRSFNLCLLGNPGVGKTTAARLISRYLHAYAILPTDNFVERNALALKGKYVGQSFPQVQEAVEVFSSS